MPSPFPGMDPWLEDPAVFPNLHERFGIFLQSALNRVLPKGYAAITKNRIWIEGGRREPDANIFSNSPAASGNTGDGGLAVAELIACGLLVDSGPASADPFEELYVEIRSDRGQRLVTVVEILSPSNKRPGDDGRAAYLEKQGEYRRAGVNTVEIDLLRAGQHTTAFSQAKLPAGLPYHACVSIPAVRTHRFLVPIPLEHPLPTLRLPLDWNIRPVEVALQSIFEAVIADAGYEMFIDYSLPPTPPLTPAQQAWADEILRKRLP
jgi:hypothetical protein